MWRSLHDFARSARTGSRWCIDDVASFRECVALTVGLPLGRSLVADHVKFYLNGAARLEILRKLPLTSSVHTTLRSN